MNRVYLIEIVLFFTLAYSLPYVGPILMISSIIRMVYPYRENQLIEGCKIPINLLTSIANKIDSMIK
jgi:hypothetical protein